MGKGRRLTTSRSERYLGIYGCDNNHNATVNDAPELGEDDVWSIVDDDDDDDDDDNIMNNETRNYYYNGNGPFRSRRRIPREGRHVGGLSLAFEASVPPSDRTTSSMIVHQFRGQHESVNPPPSYHLATSAPVNVPDWSKIYRVDLVESLHDSDDGLDDPDSEMVPPHEYLAREYARSKKIGGCASVFVGVGRTLKGRDMRRVRDAVWSQTGFDG